MAPPPEFDSPARAKLFLGGFPVRSTKFAAAKATLDARPNWPLNLLYNDKTRGHSNEGTCSDACTDDDCDDDCECEGCRDMKYEMAPWRHWERSGVMHDTFESVYANGVGPYSISRGHQIDYESCSPKELKHFVKERGLQDPYPAGLTLKALYVEVLDRADRKSTFRFVDLPAEMRNLVYAELLTFDENSCPAHRHCYAQILRTCKAIYAEVKDILYEDNIMNVNFGAVLEEHYPSTVGTYSVIHKKVPKSQVWTDFGEVPEGMSCYPDFLKRMKKLKLTLFLVDDDGDGITRVNMENAHQYLHNCLLTFASFMMDDHQLRQVRIDISGVDFFEVPIVATILYPLRRLRNVPSVNIVSDCATELAASIAHDMQGTHPVMNTLKRMQLLMAEGHAAVAMHASTNPLNPCSSLDLREGPRYEGRNVAEAIEHHLNWIECQLDDPTSDFGLFEDAEEEKKLQIRLAKILEALSTLNIDLLQQRLLLLKRAKESKDLYFQGREDAKETKELAKASTPLPRYDMW